MVTIIKSGRSPRPQAHQLTCVGCGSVLRFHEYEGTRVSDQRDGDYFTFKCPICHRALTKAVP
jgi:hypothetical protein